jgi:hypothetical protein
VFVVAMAWRNRIETTVSTAPAALWTGVDLALVGGCCRGEPHQDEVLQ